MDHIDQNPLTCRIIELDNPDLPITCPNRHTPVTFLHPRVTLQPSATGTCRCPYCSTLYIVKSLTA